MKNLLKDIEYDYVEYFVGMAKMVTYWHIHALGFEVKGYCGPETGVSNKVSYFLQKNDAKLVISSASGPGSYGIVSFVDLHGNGVKRISIKTKNVKPFYSQAIERGAIPIQEPYIIEDNYGRVEQATIKLFDDNEMNFVDYSNYTGEMLPGYVPIGEEWIKPKFDSQIMSVDHIACALRENEIPIWEKYLNDIFAFSTIQEFGKGEIETNKSGLVLKVLQSENKAINNVLVEPDNQAGKSQVQVFIDKNYGTGIQHLAFSTSNIFETLDALKGNGIILSKYPSSYYKLLEKKYPDLDVSKLKKYNLLCDVEDGAMLLQTFTTPIGDRPTLFYEIVQRVNDYQGFGLGNINTLFEAVEKDLAITK